MHIFSVANNVFRVAITEKTTVNLVVVTTKFTCNLAV